MLVHGSDDHEPGQAILAVKPDQMNKALGLLIGALDHRISEHANDLEVKRLIETLEPSGLIENELTPFHFRDYGAMLEFQSLDPRQ